MNPGNLKSNRAKAKFVQRKQKDSMFRRMFGGRKVIKEGSQNISLLGTNKCK
jgi:hypothetical protein